MNDNPVANPDAVTTNEDTPVSGNILSNDTDVDGDSLSVTGASVDVDGDGIADALTLGVATALTDNGGNPIGTLTVDATGAFTFTPAADYDGAVPQVAYTVADGNGGTASSTLDITITPVNDNPVANPDAVTTNEDTPVSGNILSNDTDVDGDTLSVSAASVDVDGDGIADALTLGVATALTDNGGNPIGTLTVDATGAFTFTPAADYDGAVPLVAYTVSDGNGGTASSTLDITITPVNDAPVANPDAVTTNEDTPVSGNILSNDTDVDGDSLSVTGASVDVDGDGIADALTLGVATALTDNGGNPIGTLTVDATGAFTFTPAADYDGAVPQVAYTVADGNGGAASSTLDITITPVNDAPVANPDAVTTNEDTPVSGNILSNDTDVDGDSLSVTGASVDVDGDGIADALTLGVATALTDNGGNPIGTLTVDATGAFTFTPAADYDGAVPQVAYTVADGNGGSASSTLDITITPVNDAPVANPDAATTNRDTPVSGNILSNDTDVDGDTLNVSAASVDVDGDGIADALTLGVATALTDNGGNPIGTLTVDATGAFTFTPAADYDGAVPQVAYTVADGNGGTASSTLDITITPVNDAPVANPDAVTTNEDTPVSGNILSNDTDVDGDSLSVTAASVDVDGDGIADALILGVATALTDNGGNPIGTLTVDATGAFTFTPAADYDGAVPQVAYTVADGNGGSASSTLDITITPVNDAPVANPDAATTNEDTPVSGNILSNDTDVDGDTLSVSAASVDVDGDGIADGLTLGVATALTDNGGNPIGTLTVDAAGAFTFTPAADYDGAVPQVAYTVSDGNGGTASSTLDITITPVNDNPVANPDAVTTNEDTPVSGNILSNDTDVDGDSLSVTGASVDVDGDGIADALTLGVATALTDNGGNPIGTLTVDATGAFTFTPAADYDGAVPQVAYTVSDGNGGSASSTLDITITPVNDAPVANPDAVTTNEDTPVSGNILSNDTDVDGDTLSVSAASVDVDGDGIADALTLGVATALTDNGGNPIGTLTVDATGAFTFTPAADYDGAVPQVAYTVSDGNGGTASSTLDITITPVNDAPVANPDAVTTNEDTPVSGNILSNDSDVDGDSLSVTGASVDVDGDGIADALTLGVATALTDNGGNPIGTLTVDATGAFTFTPAADYDGAVPQVAYTVSDGNGGSASTTLDITITPVNDNPVANPDAVTTNEDTPVSGNILSNDTDVDGDTLSVSATSVDVDGDGIADALTLGVATALTDNGGNPIGTLTVEATGAFTFTPAADYDGAVPQVAYTVADGSGGSASSTLDITITPVNDAPVANPDAVTTNEDTPVSGNILSNDTDVDGDTLSVSAASVDIDGDGIADALTLGVATALTDNGGNPIGTLTVDATGAFTFTPAADYDGAVPQVAYTVSDGNGGSASSTLDITITPVNDNPVANPDTVTTNEDTPVSGNILSNDTDVDGDSLSVTGASVDVDGDGIADALTLGVATALTDNGGNPIGTLTVDAAGAFTFTPAADYDGAVPQVAYTVADGNGGSAASTLDITITPVNDAPVANPDAVTTNEDTPVSGNILSNDTDVDGDTLSVSAASVDVDGDGIADALTLGVATALTDNGGNPIGTLTVDATGAFTFTPAADYDGSVPQVAYTVSDGNGGSASSTLDITITPVNDNPVANPDTVTTNEDTPVSGNILSNDTDVEGDTLSVSAASVDVDGDGIADALTLGVATALTDNGGNPIGTLTVDAAGAFTFTPAADYDGAVPQVAYTVSDGNGGSASTTLDITITPVNDNPVANPDAVTTNEDAPVSGNILSNDADVDGDTLSVSAASVDVDGDGIADALTLGVATVLTDNGGNPIGTLTVDATGAFTFTPAADYDGTVPQVAYTVSDGNGGTASSTLDITITSVNDAPVANPDAVTTNEDTPVSGNILSNDSDVDGDSLSVTGASVDVDGDGIADALTLGVATALTDNGGNPIGTLTVDATGAFTFTPAADYDGAVPQVAYTVADGNGGTASSTLDITITPVNDNPFANPDAVTTNEDTPVSGNILSNDTDVDGDTLNVSAASVDVDGDGIADALTLGVATALTDNGGNPIGTLTVDATGAFTFTPAADYDGAVPQVAYTVSDGNGGSASSTLDITITPVNDNPVANPDTVTTNEDTPVSGNILSNDTDVEGDTLSVSAASVDVDGDGIADALTLGVATALTDNGGNPIGTLTVDATGAFTFTPAADYDGAVPQVAYTVADGNGGTASSTLDITITPVNDNPFANPDAVTTNEDTPVSGNILSNDSDVDGDSLSVTGASVDVDGDGIADALTLGVATALTDNGGNPIGTLTVDATGAFTFTPAADYDGAVPQVAYTVSDGNGGSASTTLDITITPVNDNPVANPDAVTTNEDAPVSGNILSNDADVDGDTLSVSAASVDVDGDGIADALTLGVATALTDNGGNPIGTLTVDATGAFTFTPAADYDGAVPQVAYTVADGNGGTASSTLDITITPVNDNPFANPDAVTTNEDTPVSGNILSNDTDVDGDTLSVSAASVDVDGDGIADALTLGVATALTDKGGNPIGTLTVDATGAFTFTPAADYDGAVPQVAYTVSDGNGGTASSTLDITITPVNDNPVANPDAVTTNEDTPVSGNILSNDTDVDGDSLSVTGASVDVDGDGIADALTLGVATALTDNGGNPIGTLTVDATGAFTFTPAADYDGAVPQVAYTVADGNGGTASSTLDITITPVNDNPVANPDAVTTNEDTPVSGNILSNDTDVDGDTLSVSAASVDVDGDGIADALTLGVATALTDNGGNPIGTLTVDATGAFTFTPAADYDGAVPLVAYTVSDGNGGTASSTLDITITPVNDAPVANPDAVTTNEDTPVSGNILSNDTDVDGDSLSVTGASVDVDGDGIADALTLGVATALTDNGGNPIGTLTVDATGAFTFTPAADYDGAVPQVAYTVADGNGGAASSTLDITITPVNDAPVANPDAVTTNEDTPVSGNILSNDTDVDGDSLSVTGASVDVDGDGIADALTLGVATALTDNGGNPIGTLTVDATGAFTFTPAADYDGAVPQVAYTVADGNGGSASSTLDITITPVNDAPVANPDAVTTNRGHAGQREYSLQRYRCGRRHSERERGLGGRGRRRHCGCADVGRRHGPDGQRRQSDRDADGGRDRCLHLHPGCRL